MTTLWRLSLGASLSEPALRQDRRAAVGLAKWTVARIQKPLDEQVEDPSRG
jgi:hypothetical protein